MTTIYRFHCTVWSLASWLCAKITKFLFCRSLAYTGRFCEVDVDGCSEMTCFEGVQCTDNPAPQIGATCGPCPTGLQGDGMKCIGE